MSDFHNAELISFFLFMRRQTYRTFDAMTGIVKAL